MLIRKNLARHDGPHQKRAARLYAALRRNVVDTVYASWRETGFAWEQYDPATGRGQRTQHFTGWTSLVVKMMVMDEAVENVPADNVLADNIPAEEVSADNEGVSDVERDVQHDSGREQDRRRQSGGDQESPEKDEL
jgi:hypothetical protein